jgi:hypothetical protein
MVYYLYISVYTCYIVSLDTGKPNKILNDYKVGGRGGEGKPHGVFKVIYWLSNAPLLLSLSTVNLIYSSLYVCKNTSSNLCRWFRFAQLAKGKKSRP